jgi:hypothetical protein
VLDQSIAIGVLRQEESMLVLPAGRFRLARAMQADRQSAAAAQRPTRLGDRCLDRLRKRHRPSERDGLAGSGDAPAPDTHERRVPGRALALLPLRLSHGGRMIEQPHLRKRLHDQCGLFQYQCGLSQ